MSIESLESVFMSLPNGCSLKNPNSYHGNYTGAYMDRTKKAVYVYADTPSEAVIKLAETLASNGITKKEA